MYDCELCEHWDAPKCLAQNIVLARGHRVLNCDYNKPKKGMNKEEIKGKIKEIIVDKSGVDAKQVTDNAHFENDLGMDSLDRVELMMELEKEYKISIPDTEAEKAYTLNDCVEIVDKCKK